MRLTPGVNFMKLFWHKFTYTFCKLDHFINVNNICHKTMKRSRFSKIVSKSKAQKFYEIYPYLVLVPPRSQGKGSLLLSLPM